jgi:molecular chaperone GrpE
MSKKLKVNAEEGKIEKVQGQLVRALADYDNLKKRVEKEKKDWEEIILARFTAEILPALDMLGEIQSHIKDSGLAIAIREFEKSLENLGMEKISPRPGDVFDPELHDAVDGKNKKTARKGEILEEVLPGWRTFSGRVVRHARVKVNK